MRPTLADPLRVVLVDDSEITRFVLRTRLERGPRFVVVGEAGDARSGIEVVARSQPDLVLLDDVMPGGAGMSALPEFCSAAGDAMVVLLSARPSTPDLVAQAVGGGAQGYLTKGMSYSVLVEQIATMCHRQPDVEDPWVLPEALDADDYPVFALVTGAGGSVLTIAQVDAPYNVGDVLRLADHPLLEVVDVVEDLREDCWMQVLHTTPAPATRR